MHLTEKLRARGKSKKEIVRGGKKKAKANLKPRQKTWAEGDQSTKETRRYQENFSLFSKVSVIRMSHNKPKAVVIILK